MDNIPTGSYTIAQIACAVELYNYFLKAVDSAAPVVFSINDKYIRARFENSEGLKELSLALEK